MIQTVDDAIRILFEREVLNGVDVDVVFDTPSDEWAERRNSPTVNVYLFDIREDLKHRAVGRTPVRDATGRVTEQIHPTRWFNLFYVVTAWTQRPEDEHRILASLLYCLARHDVIPPECIGEGLATTPVHIQVAQPRSDSQSLSDVWSTLGRAWKAGLELVITMPADTRVEIPAPVVTQPPEVRMRRVPSGDGGANRGKAARPDVSASAGGQSAET